MSAFPVTRLRRLRRSDRLRALVRETRLDLDDFVLPLFVGPATEPNPDLPALGRLSVDDLAAEAEEATRLGVKAVILFGIPDEKDAEGSGAWDDDGVIQRALRALREASPGLVLLTDVCLCEYTSHGHCGVLEGDEVDNDATLELLARTAVSHAAAGADAVCPSDMMDGRVAAIRAALDEEGHGELPIVSYAAKYASAFYGPFREAADSTPAFGDRRGYQLDPANVREALRECELDVAEGADALLVKPALPNLDVLRAARERFDLPVGAYNVSGEYAMLKAAGAQRLARRAPGRARVAGRDQARRRGPDRLLLDEGARGMAVALDLWETIAQEAADESRLWGEALKAEPEREPVFSTLGEARYAVGLETIYEGYLLHYGRPRLFAPVDEDTALLLGDYLYAHGLVRIAEAGPVEAVTDLAALISLCAQLRADGLPGDGEAWAATAATLGRGEDARAAWAPGPEAERALANHRRRVE